jgi:hypothetical protein
MKEGSYWGITSVSKEVLEETVVQNGRIPDNFVDSGEGNWCAPDLSIPSTRSLLERIDEATTQLVEQAKSSGSEITPINPSVS